jgi:hypothetical protein
MYRSFDMVVGENGCQSIQTNFENFRICPLARRSERAGSNLYRAHHLLCTAGRSGSRRRSSTGGVPKLDHPKEVRARAAPTARSYPGRYLCYRASITDVSVE